MDVGVLTEHLCFKPCLLVLTLWLTYSDVIKGGPVSDDTLGIFTYKGQLQRPVRFGTLFKWCRWRVGRTANPKAKQPKAQQYIQSGRQHHRLNLYLGSAAVVFLYSALALVLGEQLSFLAVLLWIVHPVGVQSIAWISSVPYVTSAALGFGGLAWALHAQTLPPHDLLLYYLVFALFQALAVHAQFAIGGVTVILAFLGLWDYAIISGLISSFVLFTTLKESLDLRSKTFHVQQMGYASRFRPAKAFVVLKTLAYFVCLAFFPKRMGLYHTYGYHYEMPKMEMEDRYFWMGICLLPLLGMGVVRGSFPIQLSMVWFLAFIFPFLNWVTMHQFVSERYAWVPSLGVCIGVAWLIGGIPWLFWTVFGIALMRCWAHLPTYYDEVMFYLSNVWNFPKSEVAIGNLGVIYSKIGLIGSAMDTWMAGAKTNPAYDVNWYNLYSLMRSQGRLNEARNFLVTTLATPTCHFPELWKNELIDLDKEISWWGEFNKQKPEARWVWAIQTLTTIVQATTAPLVGRWEQKLTRAKKELSRQLPKPASQEKPK